jgi:hypothetical protein
MSPPHGAGRSRMLLCRHVATAPFKQRDRFCWKLQVIHNGQIAIKTLFRTFLRLNILCRKTPNVNIEYMKLLLRRTLQRGIGDRVVFRAQILTKFSFPSTGCSAS